MIQISVGLWGQKKGKHIPQWKKGAKEEKCDNLKDKSGGKVVNKGQGQPWHKKG